MSPTQAETKATARLGRCLACGAKLKLDAEREGALPVAGCPGCGLSLVSVDQCDGFPPFVAPAIGREEAWKALAMERRFPIADGPARAREARLLLAPFWLRRAIQAGPQGRGGALRSAADMRPIGLPPISVAGAPPIGLDVAARTRTGDRMGRLPDGVEALGGVAIQVTIDPEGGDPAASLGTLTRDPAAAAWGLVYYPVWAFHYTLFEKEHYHVVDAVSGTAVGPARDVRWPAVAALSTAALVAVGIAIDPLAGAFAAVPAWVAGLGVMRASIRRYRR